MKIRSITSFFDPQLNPTDDAIELLSRFSKQLAARFSQSGWTVQTTRLATPPFPLIAPSHELASILKWASDFETNAFNHGFSYLSLGPALPEFPHSFEVVPSLLSATKNTFFTAIMAKKGFGVDCSAVKACGEIIAKASTITPDGFTNLRFAALGNVGPYTPFFPAAYHAPGHPMAFSLAIECADAALEAFSSGSSLAKARQAFLEALEKEADRLTHIATPIAKELGITFKGFDFSPAPFPKDWCSLGGALEQLGVPKVGYFGSTAAAAVIADTLDQGHWLKAGFNGMMLPVLEDSILANRAENPLTIKDMLLLSTVCGTGLDTVPVPGDTTAGQLSALLLDIAALSVRLDKPLTARLMPVPGKKAGEMTTFDFDYFANGQVMAIPAAPLTDFLGSDEIIDLNPRRPK